jgi:hypothetical protein
MMMRNAGDQRAVSLTTPADAASGFSFAVYRRAASQPKPKIKWRTPVKNILIAIAAVSLLLAAIMHPVQAHPTCHKHVGVVHCH